jgi:predicted alpha/beta superfamily hydrolase
MIVVAILNTDRTRDMTPTHTTIGVDKKKWDYLSSSGGNEKFLSFIKDELAPKIESTFRTVPYRIFVGHSFAGLSVLNALCTMPDLFNAYVLIDPSLWWDDELMIGRATEKLMKSDLQGKTLFVAQGNTINSWDSINYHFESIRKFSTVLETRNRSGIRWQFKYYPEEGHSSVAFPGTSDALRFIFKKYHATFTAIKSAAELDALYEDFSREVNFRFLPPERVCQQFGGISLFLKKNDEAEKYFLMNVVNYPKSSAAYANMGQLWRSRGDRKKALEFYQKSLTLFPGNEDSKANVDQLTQELKAKK